MGVLLVFIRRDVWGQSIAGVADINGFLVERCTPMA
jgi:hypothetical protein